MIDVIIPVYGQAGLLLQCLKSVRNNSTVDHRIFVSDDPSGDAALKEVYYNWRRRMTIFQNKERLGFPGNCNKAISKTESPFFVLLNSDTRVHAGWLEIMRKEFDDPRVGAVGVKLIYSVGGENGGLVQHAGVARNTDGYPYHIYRMSDPKDILVNRRLEINCVTFACVMIRRECWNDVGPLDEVFGYGNCEDVDWCWRAREKGWKIVYQPKVEVYHREHGSFGEKLVNETAPTNFRRLMQRWKMESDEYLFSVLDMSSVEGIRDFLAEQFHIARADLYGQLVGSPKAVIEMRKAIRTDYAMLSKEDKAISEIYADRIIKRLQEGK